MSDTKLTNPKDLVGSGKLPLHLVPETMTAVASLAFLDGALKYGRANWRVAGVRASIYIDAAKRHLVAWFEGEENDPDSGVHHLGHALACIGILIDAGFCDKLNDDRQIKGGWRRAVSNLTPHVDRLKKLHEHRTDIKHYTINDNGLLLPTLSTAGGKSPSVMGDVFIVAAKQEGKA
jgi:hypothetical protein